jgi:hypothetical protein
VLLVINLEPSASLAFPSPAQLRSQAERLHALGSGNATFTASASSSVDCSAATAARLSIVQNPQRLSVFVGSVRANVTWASPEGTQVHVLTPSYEQLCVNTGLALTVGRNGDCGYQPIRLFYEPEAIDAGVSRRLASASTPIQWLGSWLEGAAQPNASAAVAFLQSISVQCTLPAAAVIQCPPWCPNAVPTSALPLTISDIQTSPVGVTGYEAWMGSVVPGQLLTDSASGIALGLSPLVAALALQYATGGLYYSSKCSAAGYTDWETGACTNTSDPAFPSCAFGAGSDCALCPRVNGHPAAICPGGYRAVPLPGYYTPAESSGLVSKCAAPSNGRCTGWNASVGAVQCGDGYAPFSPGCIACAPGYYTSLTDASCVPCPAAGPLGPMLEAILIFIGLVAGAFTVIFAVAFAAAKLRGGTIVGGSARVLDLLVWIVALLQLLAQVGRSAAAGLPPFIAQTFQFLAAFQFQSVAVPAACWSGYAFKPQVTLMGVAIGLSVALWLFVLSRGRCIAGADTASKASGTPPATAPVFRGCTPGRRLLLSNFGFAVCFGLASLLYAPTANTVFGLLACTSTVVSPLAYASLDKDAGSGPATISDGGTVSVSVLVSNPSFVCYQGSHVPAGVVAWVTLALVTIGYPLWTLLWSRARILRLVKAALARELQPATEHASKSQPGQAGVWHMLLSTDQAAVKRVLGQRQFQAWLRYVWCGQERLMRWAASSSADSTASDRNSGFRSVGNPRRPSQTALTSAVRAVSERNAGVTDRYGAVEKTTPAPSSRRASLKPAATVFQLSPLVHSTQMPKGSRPRRGSATTSAVGVLPGLLQLEACNTCADVVTDAPMRPFVGSTFRASASYSQQVDAVAMSVLAAIQWFWQRPVSTGEAAGRACLYVLTLIATAWVIGTHNPFWPHDAWKLYVKVGSLLLAALAAVLTHFSLSMTITYGVPPDTSQPGYAAASDTRTGLAYAVFVGCILLALVLVLGFWAHTVTGARREALQRQESMRARRSFLEAAADSTGLALQPQAHQAGGDAGSKRLGADGSPGQVHRPSLVGFRASFHGRPTLNPLAHAGSMTDAPAGASRGGAAANFQQRSASRLHRPSRVDPGLGPRTPQYGDAAAAALRRLSTAAEGEEPARVPQAQFRPLRVASNRLAGSAAAAAAAGSSRANTVAVVLRGASRRGFAATPSPGLPEPAAQSGRSHRSVASAGSRSPRRSSAHSSTLSLPLGTPVAPLAPAAPAVQQSSLAGTRGRDERHGSSRSHRPSAASAATFSAALTGLTDAAASIDSQLQPRRRTSVVRPSLAAPGGF